MDHLTFKKLDVNVALVPVSGRSGAPGQTLRCRIKESYKRSTSLPLPFLSQNDDNQGKELSPPAATPSFVVVSPSSILKYLPVLTSLFESPPAALNPLCFLLLQSSLPFFTIDDEKNKYLDLPPLHAKFQRQIIEIFSSSSTTTEDKKTCEIDKNDDGGKSSCIKSNAVSFSYVLDDTFSAFTAASASSSTSPAFSEFTDESGFLLTAIKRLDKNYFPGKIKTLITDMTVPSSLSSSSSVKLQTMSTFLASNFSSPLTSLMAICSQCDTEYEAKLKSERQQRNLISAASKASVSAAAAMGDLFTAKKKKAENDGEYCIHDAWIGMRKNGIILRTLAY